MSNEKPKEAAQKAETDVPMPAFYQMQARTTSLLDVTPLQKMFPGHDFWWVNWRSQKNMLAKQWKGWTPVTDKEWIKKMEYEYLLAADGRVRHDDLELWTRPMSITERAHKIYDTRLAAKSSSVRAAIDAQAEETKGRSGGKVVPFMKSGVPEQDVFTRTPVALDAPATPAKGKEK